MKNPEHMTREELIAYVGHLKGMIVSLQAQLTKALETIVSLTGKLTSRKSA